ncbi:hypothetical protein A471_22148 [Ectopseudomonas mendocina DLHK]|jgi:hypothetical protein|nr:hypothetical protein CO724_13970 [Pseudomonas mendocina]EJO91675.1 hypothetical protein A471_22148 [Pseudomonas mendocina DLHK]MBA4246164.1 O-succinylhomoserine sulfhydrylase [Pseudomonas sp.]MBF8163715.1 hypothetical protein [Pseudomonas mendocina]
MNANAEECFMRAAVSILLLGCLSAGQVWAEACYVTSSASSDAIAEVEQELCYEFTGMDEGAIDWSCSNESTDMIRREQQKVASCAADKIGSCEAALTQATLANYRAGDDDQGKPRPAVPNDAKVITHYYRAGDLRQVRIDCESSGGTWRDPQ